MFFVNIGLMDMKMKVRIFWKDFLHQEEYCKPFFKDLKTNVDEYLNHLNVDSSKLDYHVSKSWVGFHDGKVPELKPHTHNESNISFVYYVKSSENSDKFCLR